MSLVMGPDGGPRCGWCGEIAEFFPYHDREWGFPVENDQRLFEKISLEGFQSGLSWRTILNKRENFRRAFAQFDIAEVSLFGPDDVERLLQDKGIVRHRGKIEAVINNAQRAQELIAEAGSIAAFVWQYEAKSPAQPQSQTTSEEAIALSKALKKRGWKFVGPTTVFAFMQAMGLVNDHQDGCVTSEEAAKARAAFTPPRLSPKP